MSLDVASLAEEQILEFSKKIDFYTSEYTVEILADKVKKEEYFVPKYQRDFIWDLPRKSKFIESILIGLPIPFVFFWEDIETGKLEIVDGSQRLRTLEEYLNNRLVLDGLERLSALNGLKFSDLPLSRQRKIRNRSIRGIVLADKTDFESRIDLFERINTGSQVAEPAEVRRGVLRGPFMDFITSLTKNEDFRRLAPISTKLEKLREYEELITRFFAYSDGLDDYKDNVSSFIFNYISKMNSDFDNDRVAEYTQRFERMLSFVDSTFPYGFRRTTKGKATPRARFEAIAIGSYLALEKNPYLNFTHKVGEEIINSSGFIKEVRSDGANAIGRLKGRCYFIRDALLESE
ncbi:DUF262 domain-containing protein [Aeromonas salmonicida]|uniref:DUF262 domain-containing protein n=1 Tax=Aeromonas salmonicida TaxID=645 RepID=UPI00259EBB19|nr:DUF262 domain-containing protein [Aeromonas salmonicida]MDM5104002.1 DUF262 domain-containing protein [Aeromonas salmonicida]